MSLLSLQQGFRAFLLDTPSALPDALEERARPGLPIYHNAYRAQLIAALKDSYERLHAWLGDDAFDAAARDHIARHPPASWTLGDYGVGFDTTLADRYPDDPEVPELAAVDWALRRAFDGPDSDPLDREQLAAADWDRAVLEFVPTLNFVPVSTNCAAIWNAIAGEDEVPPAQILPAAATIRVWRTGLEPHFKTIEAIETTALKQCLEGVPFAKVCDELASAGGVADSVETAGALLRSWLEDGLIHALR